MSVFRRSLPFVVILAACFAAFQFFSIYQLRRILLSELRQKSEAAAAGIGHPLNEAFAMGEYDRIQRALDGLKAADSDVDYAIGIEVGSQVIASTDPQLRNRVLTRNEFEASAWQMSNITVRENPEKPKVFEIVVPVKFRSAQMGVLRIGISRTRVEAAMRNAALARIWLGALLAIVGGGLCGWISGRTTPAAPA